MTVERASKLHEEMLRLRKRDCALLDAAVNALGQSYIDTITLDNVSYDRATEHGSSEGVRWPPPD